jgi:hypothetical protein
VYIQYSSLASAKRIVSSSTYSIVLLLVRRGCCGERCQLTHILFYCPEVAAGIAVSTGTVLRSRKPGISSSFVTDTLIFGAHPPSCPVGTRCLRWAESGLSVQLSTHHHLALKVKEIWDLHNALGYLNPITFHNRFQKAYRRYNRASIHSCVISYTYYESHYRKMCNFGQWYQQLIWLVK